jgi:hypothetical protein
MSRFFSAFLAVLAASKVYASVDIVPGATWTAVGHPGCTLHISIKTDLNRLTLANMYKLMVMD